MKTEKETYEFLGLRFLPTHSTIEEIESSKKLGLTQKESQFLLILIENSNRLVEYEKFRKEIWIEKVEVDESFIHDIQVYKSKLTKKLKQNFHCLQKIENFEKEFIETVRGKGYRMKIEIVSKIEKETTQNVSEKQTKTNQITINFSQYPYFNIFVLILIIVGFMGGLFAFIKRDEVSLSKENIIAPNLTKIEIITAPKSKIEFFVNLYGESFNTQNIQVRVIGRGCPTNDPCTVENGALKLHSEISETILKNVPLTLASGKFQILAQNGNSPMSNPVTLVVP